MRLLAGAALATLVLAVGGASAQEIQTRAYKSTPDETWSKVVRYLALVGAKPTTLDRESRTIIASGDAEQGKWTTCKKRGRGVLRKLSYDVSVVIDQGAEGGSTVSVVVTGEGEQAARRRFIFIPTGMRRTELDCPSTGAFERNLFEYLDSGR